MRPRIAPTPSDSGPFAALGAGAGVGVAISGDAAELAMVGRGTVRVAAPRAGGAAGQGEQAGAPSPPSAAAAGAEALVDVRSDELGVRSFVASSALGAELEQLATKRSAADAAARPRMQVFPSSRRSLTLTSSARLVITRSERDISRTR
jgi:hypothetical protein